MSTMFHNIVKHFTMTGQYAKMFHNVSQYCILSLSGQKKPLTTPPLKSNLPQSQPNMDKKGTHTPLWQCPQCVTMAHNIVIMLSCIVKRFTMKLKCFTMFHNIEDPHLILTWSSPHPHQLLTQGASRMDKKGTHPIAVSLWQCPQCVTMTQNIVTMLSCIVKRFTMTLKCFTMFHNIVSSVWVVKKPKNDHTRTIREDPGGKRWTKRSYTPLQYHCDNVHNVSQWHTILWQC